MTKPFIAIFTETPNSGRDAVTAALLVVFANRDAQTLDDVEGTKVSLESQGEGVHVREFDFLREVPDIWDLRAEAADRAEADRIIAERASSAGVPPVGSTGVSPVVSNIGPDAVSAIHRCLRILAGTCDHARRIDGAGFNKMDAEFGHSLADAHALSPKRAVHGQKLIRKYHRQLPADLLQAALGSTALNAFGAVPVGAPPTEVPPGCLPTPAPYDAAETAARKLWTEQGVPQAKQDEIIADIAAKAKPGAMVGPFQIPPLDDEGNPDEGLLAADPTSDLRPPSSAPECVRTPAQLVNHKYTVMVKTGVYRPKSGQEVAGNGCEEWYGDTYQNGVEPGPKKLAQFREIMELTGTPRLYAQEAKGDEALVHVKLFDPTGSWTWFITEFDPTNNTAFGLVNGHEAEIGYIDLNELANVRGRMGIGIEIDMHFKPQTLAACREAIAA